MILNSNFSGRVLRSVPVAYSNIAINPAFYAYLSSDMPSPSPLHTFIYDHVVTNIDGNYNHYSGIFTVPDDGVYVFSATTDIDSSGLIYFEIVNNDVPFANGFANSISIGNHHTGTTMGIILAEQGDIIYVRSLKNPPTPPQGAILGRFWGRTSFCGWRIA